MQPDGQCHGASIPSGLQADGNGETRWCFTSDCIMVIIQARTKALTAAGLEATALVSLQGWPEGPGPAKLNSRDRALWEGAAMCAEECMGQSRGARFLQERGSESRQQGSGEELRQEGSYSGQPWVGEQTAGEVMFQRPRPGPGRPLSTSHPTGTFDPEEEVASLARPPHPTCARGPSHVHPHISHAD